VRNEKSRPGMTPSGLFCDCRFPSSAANNTRAARRFHLQSGRKIEALGQGEKPEAPGMSRVMDAFA
jgi:hypothetical protein